MKICKYINCGSEYSGGLQEKSIYIYTSTFSTRHIHHPAVAVVDVQIREEAAAAAAVVA